MLPTEWDDDDYTAARIEMGLPDTATKQEIAENWELYTAWQKNALRCEMDNK